VESRGGRTISRGRNGADLFQYHRGERLLSIWYHFAIMFEALFILTVLDAGTRVGRFMVQELGGRVWNRLPAPGGCPASWHPAPLSSACGDTFCIRAWSIRWAESIRSGRSSVSPINCWRRLALVVATTILLKMGRTRWIWVTLLPMVWLVIITMTASYQKIFDAKSTHRFPGLRKRLDRAIAAGKIPAAKLVETQRLIFNHAWTRQ